MQTYQLFNHSAYILYFSSLLIPTSESSLFWHYWLGIFIVVLHFRLFACVKIIGCLTMCIKISRENTWVEEAGYALLFFIGNTVSIGKSPTWLAVAIRSNQLGLIILSGSFSSFKAGYRKCLSLNLMHWWRDWRYLPPLNHAAPAGLQLQHWVYPFTFKWTPEIGSASAHWWRNVKCVNCFQGPPPSSLVSWS